MQMKHVYVLMGLCLWVGLSMGQPKSEFFSSKNDKGNRYEGSYNDQVSNPRIELTSFVGSVEPYEFGKGQQLNVEFYSPDASGYTLHAEELKRIKYYWMQGKGKLAQKTWNTFQDWPVDQILRRYKILYRDLAILIRLGKESEQIFAPAIIYHSDRPESFHRYIIQLRLGVSVGKGTWTLYQGKQNNAANKLISQPTRKQSGGASLPISLPNQALSKGEGWYTFEFDAKEKSNLRPVHYEFSFYHKSLK